MSAGSDRDELSEGARRFADQVRSAGDVERLSRFEHTIYLPLVLSAILPIVIASSRASDDSWISITVSIVSWAVFVVDLVAHMWLVRAYLRTRMGMFDLAVVVLTAPWFLIPGLGGSQILVVARLARLVRLVFVSKGARRVMRRLGSVGIVAVGMVLFCAWMAYIAEHPTNPEFASFTDALWWGVVTLTTVGYGDIVPETERGRLAGTFLMLTGIASLGLISGALASFFRSGADGDAGADEPQGGDVATELAAMREQLAAIEAKLMALVPESGDGA